MVGKVEEEKKLITMFGAECERERGMLVSLSWFVVLDVGLDGLDEDLLDGLDGWSGVDGTGDRDTRTGDGDAYVCR